LLGEIEGQQGIVGRFSCLDFNPQGPASSIITETANKNTNNHSYSEHLHYNSLHTLTFVEST
jgi:hypothetical protein